MIQKTWLFLTLNELPMTFRMYTPCSTKLCSALAFDEILTAQQADKFRQIVIARQPTVKNDAFFVDPDSLAKLRLPQDETVVPVTVPGSSHIRLLTLLH